MRRYIVHVEGYQPQRYASLKEASMHADSLSRVHPNKEVSIFAEITVLKAIVEPPTIIRTFQ
jgi:hypothetical protein